MAVQIGDSFQEVMRQWARMCNAVPGKSECISICSDKQSGYTCPMHNSGLCNKSIASQTWHGPQNTRSRCIRRGLNGSLIAECFRRK